MYQLVPAGRNAVVDSRCGARNGHVDDWQSNIGITPCINARAVAAKKFGEIRKSPVKKNIPLGGAQAFLKRITFLTQIGRAHVCTPVTNAHLVCRLLLEKKILLQNPIYVIYGACSTSHTPLRTSQDCT